MGTSTNAILFFGFTFADKGNEEILGEATEEQKEALQAKLDDEDEDYFYGVCKDHPYVDVDYHCMADYPMHFVHHKLGYLVVNRGAEGFLNLEELMAHSEVKMASQLKEFCTEHGIPWQEPRWTLVSYWG